MKGMRITLLGSFQVVYNDEVLHGLEGQKVQELFSYLLLHRGHPQLRETLATLLWSESSAGQAKKYLRQALWQLQTALAVLGKEAAGRLLMVDVAHLCVTHTRQFDLDVAEFETAYDQTHRLSGQELDPDASLMLQRGLDAYSGDLLTGWYADWCLCERDRLQTMYLSMLDKMMAAKNAQRDYETGIEYGLRILRYDPACERTHQRLMRLHYLMGNRTAALRQYERCVEILQTELAVRPSRRTHALYEQICTEAAAETSRPPASTEHTPRSLTGSAPASASPAGSLSEILERLKRLGGLLSDVQCQLLREIRAVEQTLQVQGTARQALDARDVSSDV